MKNLYRFMILGLLAIPAFAGFRQKIAVLGPTSTDNQASTFDITIAAGAAGVRNCLTQLDLTSVGQWGSRARVVNRRSSMRNGCNCYEYQNVNVFGWSIYDKP